MLRPPAFAQLKAAGERRGQRLNLHGGIELHAKSRQDAFTRDIQQPLHAGLQGVVSQLRFPKLDVIRREGRQRDCVMGKLRNLASQLGSVSGSGIQVTTQTGEVVHLHDRRLGAVRIKLELAASDESLSLGVGTGEIDQRVFQQ